MSPEMAAKVTGVMTTTMASAVMTAAMASTAMTSMTSTTASAERYARDYGRENNDDNSDAGIRHGTLAAAASLLHEMTVHLARKFHPRSP